MPLCPTSATQARSESQASVTEPLRPGDRSCVLAVRASSGGVSARGIPGAVEGVARVRDGYRRVRPCARLWVPLRFRRWANGVHLQGKVDSRANPCERT
jgi:hypothetical protein